MVNDVSLVAGLWRVVYDQESEALRVAHELEGIGGHVALGAWIQGERCRVRPCAEDVPGRLTLVDGSGGVCGYVAFHSDGDRLYLRCIQRAGQWLAGDLTLRGRLTFPQGFACRVHGDPIPRVIRLGSGQADCQGNDGIYDPLNDRCLWLGGASSLQLTTVEDGSFGLDAVVRMELAGANELVLTLERNFYGTRCVPYFKALDRTRSSHAPAAWLSRLTADAWGTEAGNDERKLLCGLRPFGLDYCVLQESQIASGDPGTAAHSPGKLGFKTGEWLETQSSGEAVTGSSEGAVDASLLLEVVPDGAEASGRAEVGHGALGLRWIRNGRYTGAEASSADVSGVMVKASSQALPWQSVIQQAKLTLSQLFVHGIAFWLHTGEMQLSAGLSLEECRVAMVLNALPGQAWVCSDSGLGQVPERLSLARQSLPTCPVHPLDLYPLFDLVPVWDLKICRSFGTWDVVALFNWGEEEDEISFDFGELGLSRAVRHVGFEFFTGCCVGCHDRQFGLVVPPHSVRVVAFHDLVSRPQFLSSSRHISQGGTDLVSLDWRDGGCELRGSVSLVGGHETVLSFHVPKGYACRGVEVSAGCQGHVVSDHHGILRVSLLSQEGGCHHFQVLFKRVS